LHGSGLVVEEAVFRRIRGCIAAELALIALILLAADEGCSRVSPKKRCSRESRKKFCPR
jgi:hypothetical protein